MYKIRLEVILEPVSIDLVLTRPHAPMGPGGLDSPRLMKYLVDIQINPSNKGAHLKYSCQAGECKTHSNNKYIISIVLVK